MQIVIDTNFAYSCLDNTSTDNDANECGNILIEIYDSNHVIIISPKIADEWEKHAIPGSGSYDWYTRMLREHRYEPVTNENDKSLRSELKKIISKIYSTQQAQIVWKIVEKDLHLIECANIRHKTIISREKKVRDNLRDISTINPNFRNIGKLRTIIWIRPQESYCDENNVVLWLRETSNFWVKRGCRIKDLHRTCLHWKLIE